jgi:ATP-dependent Clp protease, protease subunit
MRPWFEIEKNPDGSCAVHIGDRIGYGASADDFAEQLGDSQDIVLTVDSDGGSGMTALGVFLCLEKRNVTAHVRKAYSSASIIILAAGKRIGTHATKIMVHGLRSALAFDTAANLRREADSMDEVSAMFANTYAQRTKAPGLIDHWLRGEEDFHFDAEEALRLGFLTEIEPELTLVMPAERAAEASAVNAQTDDEKFCLDILTKAFGNLRVADHKKFSREINTWLSTVRQ